MGGSIFASGIYNNIEFRIISSNVTTPIVGVSIGEQELKEIVDEFNDHESIREGIELAKAVKEEM